MNEPSSFGVLVSLTAQAGKRGDVLRMLTHYLRTLARTRDLLEEPPSVRPLTPVGRHVSSGHVAE